MGTIPLHVTLIGAGQVGRAFSKALKARGHAHRLLSLRRGLPERMRSTDLVLICVRDGQIPAVARSLTGAQWAAAAVVAHVSGVLGVDALAALRPHCRAIGQLHPFLSIRSIGHVRDFTGAYFLGDGDRTATTSLRRFVGLLGARFVSGHGIDRSRYHLAAAVVANGSVALLAVARGLLVAAGVEPNLAEKMLLELEHSVLHNAARLGVQAALTGPVRRGDTQTVRRHLALLADTEPATKALYLSLLRSQLDIVRSLGELEARELRGLTRLLRG